jgi:hypothetical protein
LKEIYPENINHHIIGFHMKMLHKVRKDKKYPNVEQLIYLPAPAPPWMMYSFSLMAVHTI